MPTITLALITATDRAYSRQPDSEDDRRIIVGSLVKTWWHNRGISSSTFDPHAMARIELLEEALRTTTQWMTWWLSQETCDCDTTHTCGLPDRRGELERAQSALAPKPALTDTETTSHSPTSPFSEDKSKSVPTT
jgi:hypothetical protein